MAHSSERFGSFHHPHSYELVNRILRFRRVYRHAVDDVMAAGLPAGAAVLDAGTGPGHLPIALARRRSDLRVEGLDLSEEMIAYARDRAERLAHARKGQDGSHRGPPRRRRVSVPSVPSVPFSPPRRRRR